MNPCLTLFSVVCCAASVAAGTAVAGQSLARADLTALCDHATTVHPLALVDSLTEISSRESAQEILAEAVVQALALPDSSCARNLLVAQGVSEARLRRFEESLETLGRAEVWSRTARDTVNLLITLGWISDANDELSNVETSVAVAERMATLAVQAHQPIHEARAHTLLGYYALWKTSDLGAARDHYLHAISLYTDNGLTKKSLTPLTGLGVTYYRMGDAENSQACYQKVYLLASDLGSDEAAGNALNNLGTLEHTYGDISQAIAYYERARVLYRAAGYVGGVINTSSNIADGLMNLGRYGDAIEILTTALVLAKDTDYRQRVGQLRAKFGWALLEANRPERALVMFQSAEAMGDTLKDSYRSEAALGHAQTLRELGRLDEANDILVARLPLEPDDQLQADIHTSLAYNLRVGGEPVAALGHARKAVDLSRSFEGLINHEMVVLELSACLRSSGDFGPAAAAFDKALAIIEDRRLRTSEENWREAHGTRTSEALVEAATIKLDHPTEAPIVARQIAFYDVLRTNKARTLVERIHSWDGPEAYRTHTPLNKIQQDMLLPGDLVLEFSVSKQKSWLFATTLDHFRMVELPGSDSDFVDRIASYVNLMAHAPTRNSPSARDLAQVQVALGDDLFGEVADLIAASSRLIVIPDGFFHTLPVGTLALSLSGLDSHPLLATHQVYRLPAASFLATSMTDEKVLESASLIAIAGVDRDGGVLSGAEAEVKDLQNRFAETQIVRSFADSRELNQGLSAATVLHIAAHVDINSENPWHSGILLPRLQTVNAVEGRFQNPPNTSATRSILTGADSARIRETAGPGIYLRASDIARTELHANLVVLSGCESALGRVTTGEGVIGLGGAFLSAGARTVVATLWPVDDQVTADLMRAFYDGLAADLTVSGALRRAQLEVASQATTSHPFYWAGFIAIGDGKGTVPLRRRTPTNSLFYAIIGSLSIVLLGFIIARLAGRGKPPRPSVKKRQ